MPRTSGERARGDTGEIDWKGPPRLPLQRQAREQAAQSGGKLPAPKQGYYGIDQGPGFLVHVHPSKNPSWP